MTKEDDYRTQAANAQAMADKTKSAKDKSAWLRIAQGWLSMIRKPRQTAQQSFDDKVQNRGTGQNDSNSSH